MTVEIPNYTTSTMAAAAWIGSIPGFNPAMVGKQVPPDASKGGGQAPWVAAGLGFVQVAVVGGSPDPMLPIKRPVIEARCWDVVPGSSLPPWNMASALAEGIRYATLDRINCARRLEISQNGVPYPPASVQVAKVMTEPRELYNDAGDYAGVSIDVWMQWITLTDVLL